MSKDSDFKAEATFKDSLEQRITGYERKADKAKKKWRNAERLGKIAGSVDHIEIPTFHLERKFNDETKKVSFEIAKDTKKIKTPHLEGVKRLKKKAYYEASGYVHSKISENEEDNTAVEAAHKTEKAGEEIARDVKRALPDTKQVVRKAQRKLDQVAKKEKKNYYNGIFKKELEEKKLKDAGGLFTKEAAKKSGDTLIKKTAVKKAEKEVAKKEAERIQKQMVKKAVRKAQREAAKKTAEFAAVKTAEGTATVATTTAAGTTATHTVGIATGTEEVILIISAVITMIIVFIVVAVTLTLLFLAYTFFQTNVAGAMYQSEPTEIEAAELHYTYMEACLREYIENIEEHREGYDGYVIEGNYSIWHNPYTLINYLSAKYGEFTFNEVKDEIEDLFSESYTITTWVEEVEITPSDDEDEDEEESDEDEDEEDDEPETIILHILHFKVDRKPLEEIVADRMNDEEKEVYELYGETHGGLQFIKSPTGDDYSNRISSYYGYRYHPISNEIRLHRGLDIALPEGTNLYAGIDGVITTGSDPSGYGNYVIISGADGVQVRYAHMKEFAVSTGDVVTKGTVIGQSGNTGASTGPHVHVEVLENGDYRNPLFYLDTE